MPTNRKLSLMLVTFAYSGNSTGSSLCWPTAEWLIKTAVRLKTEEKFTSRIDQDRIFIKSISDTPITATRNAAIKEAQEGGIDLVLMLDSDMSPDVHVGEHPDAVPFFDTAFDFIYERYEQGPNFVAAPYGGAPVHENVFGFCWERHSNLGEEAPFELRQYNREECVYFSGIREAAAAATGLILYDIRCFDLIDRPYFQYEWTDESQSKKASTEDVQNTRDISMAGLTRYGYNPCNIAWSSWAGHNKNWCVKKPQPYTASMVSKTLTNALSRKDLADGRVVQVENLLGPQTRKLFANMPPDIRVTSRIQATDSAPEPVEVAQ